MLQAGGGNRELQRLLLVLIAVQAVEQTAAEAVSAADAVHDVADLVASGFVEMPAVVQAGGPAVPVCALRLAQGNGDHLHIRIGGEHLVAQGFVFRAVQLAGFDHHVRGDFQRLLDVLLVGDGNVHIVCDLAHHLCCPHAVLPQVFPVVQVTGDGDSPLFGLFYRLEAEILGALGYGGRDPGDVEPVDPLKCPVPVDVAGAGQRDGGIRTVIDDLAGALVGAGLQEINAETALVAADDTAYIHAEFAQITDAFIRNDVFRQDGQIGHILSVVCQGYGDIRLTPAEGCLQHLALEKTFQPR